MRKVEYHDIEIMVEDYHQVEIEEAANHQMKVGNPDMKIENSQMKIEENHQVEIEEQKNHERKVENPDMKFEENHQMEIEEQKNHERKVENPDMKFEENHQMEIEEAANHQMKVENHMIKNEENHQMEIEENHVKQEENDVAKVEEHQEKLQDQELDHLNTTNQTNQAASSGPSDLQKASEKKNRRCPLCSASLTHLGKHLKGLHKVSNAEEKHIPVKLGSKRISIRECPCPVPGCTYASGKHLDRHLGCYHSELSHQSRSRMTERARFLLAIDQLAKLRATDPSPPMVSTLDLEDPPQVTRDEPLAEDTAEEQVLDHEECRRAQARSREEAKHLGRENAALRARVRELSQALTTAKRVAAGAKKGPALVGSPSLYPEEEQEEEEEEILLKSQKTDHPHRPTVTSQQVPLTSSARRRARVDLMHRLVLPRSVETCIDRYRKHFTYKYGSRKMKEGISRLKSFLRFMAEGHTLLSSWTFLYNPGRIDRWIQEMTTSGKEVATVHQIFQFICYIRKNRPKHCRLSNSQTACILKILEKAKKDTRQAHMLHQNQMRRAETMLVPEPESILKCIRVAPAFIEGTLDELEKDPYQTTLRYELYGYLTAYWACTSGHRPGVFINMQDSEVDAAARKQTSQGVLIRVAEHETSSQCGEAPLALTEREFGWVKRLRDMKKKLCVMNKFLLFTLGKLPFRNIIQYLNVAWSKMGLGGTVNFTLIRTALADSAKSQLTAEERTTVSSFMCDDTKTASRFSVLNPSLQEAIRIRTLMTEALSRVASPEQPCTSSAAQTGARKAKRKRTEEEWCSSELEEESEEETEEEEEEEAMEEESEEVRGMGMRSPTKPLIIPCSVKISPLKTAELQR
ncbi:uncharacterized protein V3H82_013332 [Fundulus diaphanus]